jgi:carboxyl-terminal processing protease
MTDRAPDSPLPSPPPDDAASEQPQAAPQQSWGPPPAVGAPVGRSSPLTWVVSLALAAMVGAILFISGYLAAGAGGAASCAAPAEEFEAFCEAYDRIQDQFVDDPVEKDLVEGAIRGMFEYGLDPFSAYMSPEDYQRAQEDLAGQFSGIGAEMQILNVDDPDASSECSTFDGSCVLAVVRPLEGSPAEAAGLRQGDVVTAVDGESVEGMTLDEAVLKVRGEAGTDVTLTVRRGAEAPFDVRITRAAIRMREVTTDVLAEGRVGYVSLESFSNTAADQLHEAIGELLDDGVEALVFDLRDNGGGYIETARQIASEFIAEGRVFTQESAGDEVKQWEATGEGLATDPSIPVVVLVNERSASASEIVAAALKERGRATLVGRPTFGKNTVQVWSELENGAGVRITVSRWFTPDHNSVAPDGIQPDVVVEVPEGTPPERDLFLERAVEILTARMLGTDDGAGSPAPAADGQPSGETSFLPGLNPVSYDPSNQLRATV